MNISKRNPVVYNEVIIPKQDEKINALISNVPEKN
jgi:hypothetical protein